MESFGPSSSRSNTFAPLFPEPSDDMFGHCLTWGRQIFALPSCSSNILYLTTLVAKVTVIMSMPWCILTLA